MDCSDCRLRLRCEINELAEVFSVERKLAYPPLVHAAGDFYPLCLHDTGFCCDRDELRRLAERQGQVDSDRFIQRNDQSILNGFAETLLRGCKAVISRREPGKVIDALRVGHHVPSGSARSMDCRYHRTFYREPVRVQHPPADNAVNRRLPDSECKESSASAAIQTLVISRSLLR
jgi:hypothetical protein